MPKLTISLSQFLGFPTSFGLSQSPKDWMWNNTRLISTSPLLQLLCTMTTPCGPLDLHSAVTHPHASSPDVAMDMGSKVYFSRMSLKRPQNPHDLLHCGCVLLISKGRFYFIPLNLSGTHDCFNQLNMTGVILHHLQECMPSSLAASASCY